MTSVFGFSQAFDLAWGIILVTLVGIVVIALLTVGIIAWVFRRVSVAPQDPAITELKRRLADGEISPVEYEVRLRAIQHPD
jgi:uncharacterized membrane protein